MKPKRYHLLLPSSQAYLPQADRFLEENLRKAGLDPNTITDLAISLTELVNNAIVHGNKFDLNKRVSIDVELREDRLTIAITDQGQGFRPQDIPDPLREENLLKETGRGIFIVRSLVDNLEIKSLPEGGTQTVIVKYLSSQ